MLTVRPATPDDIPAIEALLLQVDMVHHRGRPDLFRGPAVKYDPPALAALLASPESFVFVCESDWAVVGHAFCELQTEAGNAVLHPVRTLYIDDICVDETARGQHVGVAIYEHILVYARRCGCYNITLNVWSCNPGAMRFYERLGLMPYKTGMEMIL